MIEGKFWEYKDGTAAQQLLYNIQGGGVKTLNKMAAMLDHSRVVAWSVKMDKNSGRGMRGTCTWTTSRGEDNRLRLLVSAQPVGSSDEELDPSDDEGATSDEDFE